MKIGHQRKITNLGAMSMEVVGNEIKLQQLSKEEPFKKTRKDP